MLFPEGALVERHVGTGQFRGMEFMHVNARKIVNKVPAASRMPFRYTINAYRGCSHACTYCFARPTHDLPRAGNRRGLRAQDRGQGQRRRAAPSRAGARALGAATTSRWGRTPIPYQKAEGKYHLTQGIVGVLGESAAIPSASSPSRRWSFGTSTLLAAAADRTKVRVNLSIGTLDRDVWRLTEPGHAAARQAGGCRPAAQRGRGPLRRARRSDPARAVRRGRPAPRGRRGVRRGRGRLDHDQSLFTCVAGSASTT